MKFNFSNVKALVVGDLMLDKYIFGKSNRLSPEAPVPVLLPIKKYSVPGGAANVAINLSSLNVMVTCLGIVGKDNIGKELIDQLNEKKINTEDIIKVKKIPTTLKERIYLNDKQILRIDEEKIINSVHNEKLKKAILKIISTIDIIILSDYNKGVLNNNIIDFIVSLASEYKTPVIVDPKKNDFSFYKGADIITPNFKEFSIASSLKKNSQKMIVQHAEKLIKKNKLKFIVITRGSKGMLIVGENYSKNFTAKNIEFPDVTGAGDTVVAILSILYALTKNIEFSVEIANEAAAYVVSKPGTSYTPFHDFKKIIKKVGIK